MPNTIDRTEPTLFSEWLNRFKQDYAEKYNLDYHNPKYPKESHYELIAVVPNQQIEVLPE